jgi:tRNA dimethylallyltransferase
MGPTASGKTQLALDLSRYFPCEIISVDSAMVYKGMDVGTAKPSLAEQKVTPHHLIDVLDPGQPYSAGRFCKEAVEAIDLILAKGKIPLLVGGTMLYFRALQRGLSPLPKADPQVRQNLSYQGQTLGWEALHRRLAHIDPDAASRISPNDAQRIQRALEVYALTGMSLTAFCQTHALKPVSYSMVNVGIMPADREQLRQRIAVRFTEMLQNGLLEEVQRLKARGDLSADMPSIRAVGYNQAWHYLSGTLNQQQMTEKAIFSTRQLAKRQMTWLRSWPGLQAVAMEDTQLKHKVLQIISSTKVCN